MSSHDSNYQKMSEYRAKTPLGRVSESKSNLFNSAQIRSYCSQLTEESSRPSTAKRKYASVQPLNKTGLRQSQKNMMSGLSSLYASSRSPTESLSEVQLQQQQTLRDRNVKKIHWYWSRLHFPAGECDKLRKTILADNTVNNLKAQNGYILVLEEYFNKKEKALSAIAARNSSLRWLANSLDRGDLNCLVFEKKVAKNLRLLRRQNIEISSLIAQLTNLKSKSLVWLPPADQLKQLNQRGLSLIKSLEKNEYMKRLKLFVKDFIYFQPQSGKGEFNLDQGLIEAVGSANFKLLPSEIQYYYRIAQSYLSLEASTQAMLQKLRGSELQSEE